MKKFEVLIKKMIDLIYPPEQRCCLCGMSSSKIVCEACMSSVEFLEGRVCFKCGKGLNENYKHSTCPDCLITLHHYDKAFSCFEYKDTGKNLIHMFKFQEKREIAPIIAKLMLHRLECEVLEAQVVVPVPIHESKLKLRGFNQSQLIALYLSRSMGIPLLDCLERSRETQEQFSLNKAQRFLNLTDAFSMKTLYNIEEYKTVLLVDDIYTTGSTINECSKVLKMAGFQRVYAITAATGSNT